MAETTKTVGRMIFNCEDVLELDGVAPGVISPVMSTVGLASPIVVLFGIRTQGYK
jgi:hypothetical protein